MSGDHRNLHVLTHSFPTRRSSELATINGISNTYEDKGPRDAPVILLVIGLGSQLTLWPDEFVDGLNARGFRTIRYDNRDVGLSTRFEAAAIPNVQWMIVKSVIGMPVRPAYQHADMEAAGIGLLAHLGITTEERRVGKEGVCQCSSRGGR